MANQMYQCPNCHQPVEYGAKFCNHCGAQMNWGNVAPAEESNSGSGNQKKILLIGAVVIVAAALAYYFLNFLNAPANSMKLAYEAYKKADYQKFEQYVDVKSTFESAVPDMAKNFAEAKSKDPNSEEAQFGAALMQGMLKAAVPEMQKSIKNYVVHHNDTDSNLSQVKAKKDIASIAELAGLSENMSWKDASTVNTKDNTAIVSVKFHDEDLNKDYSLNFKMVKAGDYWKVVGVTNLYEVAHQRRIDGGGKSAKSSAPVEKKKEKPAPKKESVSAYQKGQVLTPGNDGKNNVYYKSYDNGRLRLVYGHMDVGTYTDTKSLKIKSGGGKSPDIDFVIDAVRVDSRSNKVMLADTYEFKKAQGSVRLKVGNEEWRDFDPNNDAGFNSPAYQIYNDVMNSMYD